MALKDRIIAAVDAFRGGNVVNFQGYTSGSGPLHRNIAVRSTVDSFASAAFNRIAIDASMVEFNHVRIKDKETNKEEIYEVGDTDLARCLGLDCNIDQTGRQLIHDIVYSLFDEGIVAVVPISVKGTITLRTARIISWMPSQVRVECYNELSGKIEQLTVDKETTAIIENPLYAITNGPNTTLRRLINKMNQIDQIDAITSSGQMDLIIQSGVPLLTQKAKDNAKERTDSLAQQLSNNRFGVTYLDSSEHITQLNRPVNDSLLPQIDKLTDMFHNQLGLTPNVLNGTANNSEMNSYYARSIDPILLAITDAFTKAFLDSEEKKQGDKVTYYRDPFRLVSIEALPDIIDKTSRNEITTPNENRKILGLRPSNNPDADELRNRNMGNDPVSPGYVEDPDSNQNDDNYMQGGDGMNEE